MLFSIFCLETADTRRAQMSEISGHDKENTTRKVTQIKIVAYPGLA